MPSPTETKTRRRLIPEPSDNIEVGGQILTRVKRGESESAVGSMEELAQKHLGGLPNASQVLEENADILRALSDDREPLPPADLASRVELYTTDAPVPPEEPDPDKRLGVTVSPIVATDDTLDFLRGKAAPETIFDLFSLFPQLDGDNWWIYVERKSPRTHSGTPCSGVLRPIRRALTLPEWQDLYGGGTYKLIVYGPPKRGLTLDANGKYPSKALTEPITMTFPGVPSFVSMVYDDSEDYFAMTQSQVPFTSGRRGGPSTVADAKIVDVEVQAQLTREERQEAKELRERKEREDLIRTQASTQQGVVKEMSELAKELAEQQSTFRHEQMEAEREHQRELNELRVSFEKKMEQMATRRPERSELDTVLQITKGLAGDGQASQAAMDALRNEHSREVDRLTRQSAEERERADRRVADERERADRLIEDEKRRAQERVSELERRTKDLETDLRARADKEVREAREDAERRLSELHRQFESSKADMERNHQRETQAATATHSMALETLKATYDMRLENARSEIKRAASDADRYKKDAEDNKDVVGQITKLKETAASLGMVDASEAGGDAPEPETMTQSLLKMGAGLFGNLPQMIESFASMSKGRTQAELSAQRGAGREAMIASAGFAPPGLPPGPRQSRFGGGELRHMSEVVPPPRRPGQDPSVIIPPAPAVALTPMDQMQPPPPPQMPRQPEPLGGSMPPPAYVEPRQPAPSMPPPPPAGGGASQAPPAPAPLPAAPATTAEDLQMDQQLLQAEPILLQQYNSKIGAVEVARQTVQQYGVATVRQLVSDIGSADRLVLAFERSGNPASAFARRDGKKFLRALFGEFEKATR